MGANERDAQAQRAASLRRMAVRNAQAQHERDASRAYAPQAASSTAQAAHNAPARHEQTRRRPGTSKRGA
ncbi:MAG: hypothetical protein LBL83_01690, partial [Clostridiales bacterium]|nr:hypothetical protein [Clostridiales bacterium]